VKTLKKFLLYGLLLAAIGVAFYVSFAPRATLIDSTQVTRGPLQVSIVEEGKTRVVDRYVVSAPIAGYARRLQLKVGDAVQAGQVLLQLDPPAVSALDPRSRADAESRVATAEASLAAALEEVPIARADSRYWETELPRIREGVEAGLIASRELTQAEASQRTAEAKLDAAESKVGIARAELESAKTAMRLAAPQSGTRGADSSVAVRAPSAGRILKIINESEGVVSVSQPLVELGNTQGLEVEVEVLSSDAVQIASGMRVLLERWGGDNPLEAIVRHVEPVAFTKISALGVEEQRVLVIVDLTAPREQWQGLGDQYRVEARFIVWEEPSVLQAPSSALFRHEGGWAAFRAQDGVARIQPVEVGKRGGVSVQILSGLSESDVIVNHPGDSIADGGLVEVQQP
jgi:HlyD family secretion protein